MTGRADPLAVNDADRYFKAMVRGDTFTCESIEKSHDLFGYPPELVSVGLQAVCDGADPHDAIEKYMRGESP